MVKFCTFVFHRKRKMKILITNDDGYTARGINLLAQMMRKYGEVTVVAPKISQSGKSAGLTLGKRMYLETAADEPGFRVFVLDGTPVDCVKMGVRLFLDEGGLPDLVLSGINHGANTSTASLYSGTLGAAAEAAVYDIPAIGLSLDSHEPDADFTGALRYGEKVVQACLKEPMAKGTYVNVNVPDIPADDILGFRFARRGKGRWVKEYDEEVDDEGRKCYVMRGRFQDLEAATELPADGSPAGDHTTIHNNYVSVVAHTIDNTDYAEVERLASIWKL